MQTSGASLQCDGLWKVFGPDPDAYLRATRESDTDAIDARHTVAVRDVSFQVAPGETFVVMGLSGSGKSTLIRCVARLVEPTAGSVAIDDQSVLAMTPGELRRLRRGEIAMVFQHFGLFPHRRVLDNVAYGLEVTGVTRAARDRRAREVTDLVGLTGWESRYPDELSGGMKQRVGLARALAVDPRLLFFDEPFSALDPLIRRELQDELLRLARVVRKTFVFITHDMSEALKLGDRIAIMRDGRLVQIGRPEEILLYPADDYVRRFTADAPRLRILRAETVAEEGVIVRRTADPADVRGMLAHSSAPAAFVVDDTGRFAGRVNGEALRAGAGGSPSISAVTEPDAATVPADLNLEQVISLLAGGEESVAVVDDERRVVGAIDAKCVLRALVKAEPPVKETVNA